MAPYTPIVTIAHFRQRYNVAESGHFLQWGYMDKSCRIQLKYRIRVRLKRCNDRGELEIDRAKSKNNVAENSIAL